MAPGFKALFLVTLAVLTTFTSASFPKPSPKCRRPAERKEWRAMKKTEQADWLRAFNCLTKLPHRDILQPTINPTTIPPVNTSSSFWDDIVYLHMDLNIRIHNTGQFLPWHRWYLHVTEKALKEECGYRGVAPYWDWTLDTPNFYSSPFFQDSDPKSGLGGWGDPTQDFAVTDGALSQFHLSYPSPHILRRNYTAQPYLTSKSPLIPDKSILAEETFRKEDVERVVTTHDGDFKGFTADLEGPGGVHGGPHLIMGGDLGGSCPSNAPTGCRGGPTFSANDPLFQLHHAMIDKLWFDWQNHHPKNKRLFHGGFAQANSSDATDYLRSPTGKAPWLNMKTKMPADGLFPEQEIGDVMDTTGGYLCYVYV